MGFFDKIFKSEDDIAKKEIKRVPWTDLSDMDTLDEIVKDSYVLPVAVFKHSTRCGISNMVLRQFEKEYNIEEGKVKLYFLDLLAYRDISNKVASKFNVPHESPQLIILKEGKVVYDGSHSSIKAHTLKGHVEPA